MKRILAAIVHNEAGVLSRVTSVLNRRQVNIESISVGTTEQPEFSRMTIIINAENPLETEQVTKQLNKQIDVLKVSDITEDPHIERELVLIKVNAPTTTRSEIQAVIEPFRAHIVDVADSEKVAACIDVLRPYGIKQMARTGVTGFIRG